MAAELEALAERVAATWVDDAGARFVRLGRYQLDREIGRGTFGVVFAGFDCELEREVALKVFHIGTPERTNAVLHEARALASVAHPNVVALHDLGRDGELAYLVLDYVDGWTMAERIQRPIEWRSTVRLFIQAARGLAAVHRAGLEHGDVKPSNILVGRDGRVQIADLGLSRSLLEGGEAEPRERGGTWCYAAPEWLFEGHSDARSDQFSFCVALWEALYGQRPWAKERIGYEAMLVEVVEPAKQRSPVGIPERMERAIRRGLAARPGDRFASMDDLAEALALALISSERRRTRRQKRLGLGAVATVAVVLVAKLLMASAVPTSDRPGMVANILEQVSKLAWFRAVMGDDQPRDSPSPSREARRREGDALAPRVDLR
jgi:serine/threonine protein kinase